MQERSPLLFVIGLVVHTVVLADDGVVEVRVELVHDVLRHSYVVEIDLRGPFQSYGADDVFSVGGDEVGEGGADAP